MIKQKTLIVTCESCRAVRRYNVEDDAHVEQILKHHQCENKCKNELRSYILIGEISLSPDNGVYKKATKVI